MPASIVGALGWARDLPDHRDYSLESDSVKAILDKSRPLKAARKKSPMRVDLRKWCSPIENQGQIGSCTANAGVAIMEYFQRRAYQQHMDGSRLFLYKTTRNLLGWKGDQGAYLRATMKAMVLFGVPPEQHYPYDEKKYDDEPSPFLYAFALSYKAVKYFRLDPPGLPAEKLLQQLCQTLAAGLPAMFGFSVFSSISSIPEGSGDIPYPGKTERQIGGHAVVAVGYDDRKKIGDCTGALLIRNSWGTEWGENGYGWLPYAYVEKGLAVDFWSLTDAGFVDTDLFR